MNIYTYTVVTGVINTQSLKPRRKRRLPAQPSSRRLISGGNYKFKTVHGLRVMLLARGTENYWRPISSIIGSFVNHGQ